MPVPTARLAIVTAVASVAMFAAPGDALSRILIVNGLVLAIGVIDWLAAPRAGAFSIARDMPGVIVLGSTGTVTWRVTNQRSSAFRIRVADELAPSLRAGSRRFAGVVPGKGTLTVSTNLRPSRRGHFRPSELAWRTEGRLGLLARQGTTQRPVALRVYPRFRSREEAELRIDRARILEVGLRSAKGRGGGTEFDQLREYTVDDESSRIDWAATARAGRPIVRTYRAERNQNVVILFDNGRVMADRVDGVPRAEFAMDAALLITTVATRLGDRCGLVAFDRQVRTSVPLSSGRGSGGGQARGQVARVTEALYELQPALADSDYRAAFYETVARFRRRALIVILTDLVEQAVGEALLPALPVLSRSHVLMVGAIRDPEVNQWANERATDSESAYRQAAAARTLRARERAAANLTAAGVTVVDAAPEELAAKLGDAYLDIKATGRL